MMKPRRAFAEEGAPLLMPSPSVTTTSQLIVVANNNGDDKDEKDEKNKSAQSTQLPSSSPAHHHLHHPPVPSEIALTRQMPRLSNLSQDDIVENQNTLLSLHALSLSAGDGRGRGRGGGFPLETSRMISDDESINIGWGRGDPSDVVLRKRKIVIGCLCLVTIALMGGLRWEQVLVHHRKTSSSSSSLRIVIPQMDGLAKNNNLHASLDHQLTLSRKPLSQLDPVVDLGLLDVSRPFSTQPGKVVTTTFGSRVYHDDNDDNKYDQDTTTTTTSSSDNNQHRRHGNRAIPTNAWYQNFLLLEDDEPPTELQRAYTIPYIVDVVGPVPGLRVQPPWITASTPTIVQANTDATFSLTVGVAAAASMDTASITMMYKDDIDPSYYIDGMTELALTLAWNAFPMRSTLVKGMAVVTMQYYDLPSSTSTTTTNHDSDDAATTLLLRPTIVSEISLDEAAGSVLVDDQPVDLKCPHAGDVVDDEDVISVRRTMQLYFTVSDFTWLVLVSKPVHMRCRTVTMPSGSEGTMLQVVKSTETHNRSDDDDDDDDDKPLFLQVALIDTCTKGFSPYFCSQEHMMQPGYVDLIQTHGHLIPGPNATFSYAFDETEESLVLRLDWNVQDTLASSSSSPSRPSAGDDSKLLMFALPHHMDMTPIGFQRPTSVKERLYCTPSLVGPACLVQGNHWDLVDHDVPKVSFDAQRRPAAWALSDLAVSLRKDVSYRLPDNYLRGAGDTYFSGKMLARLGRILVIADELLSVCGGDKDDDFYEEQEMDPSIRAACQAIELPTEEDLVEALASLRSSTEVWLNGTAEAPFVYDSSWGGVANCGCLYDGGHCTNRAPDCPAFSDSGLNFGNGFYNDLHYHYGYHIYAAAVVARYDPEWGKRYFESVLLLVRSIANPSPEDPFFPVMRHRDVYQGHSYASGVTKPVPLNGRNQESSSEAIAAYESVALYGQVMAAVFEGDEQQSNLEVATEVRRAGKFLLAGELCATKRYWHVQRSSGVQIYPPAYRPYVVGIVWQTMVEFQTYFGNAPYLAYGIQLLPLTPIAEQRDDLQWMMEMYPSFAASCQADEKCKAEGWSILQLGAFATVGHPRLAANYTNNLNPAAYDTPGGNGHSKSNTLWYIATRPAVKQPLSLTQVGDTDATMQSSSMQGEQPKGNSEPSSSNTSNTDCPPCVGKENQCPEGGSAPFLCLTGASVGGCSPEQWSLSKDSPCQTCCEIIPG